MYYILHHIPSILKPRQITTKAERLIPINPCATRHTFLCCTVPASLQGWTGFNFCLVSRTLGEASIGVFPAAESSSSCRTHGATSRRTRSSWTLCGRGCSDGGKTRLRCPPVGSGRAVPSYAGIDTKGVVPPIYLTLRILTQVCSAPSRLCKLPCYGDIVSLWCSKRQITIRKAY